jgi:hypothetical protein
LSGMDGVDGMDNVNAGGSRVKPGWIRRKWLISRVMPRGKRFAFILSEEDAGRHEWGLTTKTPRRKARHEFHKLTRMATYTGGLMNRCNVISLNRYNGAEVAGFSQRPTCPGLSHPKVVLSHIASRCSPTLSHRKYLQSHIVPHLSQREDGPQQLLPSGLATQSGSGQDG